MLASAHGAQGAAAGSALGEVVLAGGLLVGLIRHDPALRPQLANAGKALLVALPWLALLLVPGLPSLAAAAIGGVGYVVGLVLVGAVPDEVWVLLRRRQG